MSMLSGLENEGQNDQILPGYGQGLTEFETRQAIREIEEEKPLTGVLRTVKQLAISLAISIDRGNNKGRAVANEAGQLFAMMQQLAPPVEAETDDSTLTPEMRRILDALGAPAEFDAAPPGDGEGL